MPDKEDRSKKKWYILDRYHLSLLLVLLAAILFYVGLTHFSFIAIRIKLLGRVLSPFIAGFAIAYLLNTPMCFFERKLYHRFRHKRILSITTVYLIAVAFAVILLNMVIPQVFRSAMSLSVNMQAYLERLEDLVKNLEVQFQLDSKEIDELLGSYQHIMNNFSKAISSSLPQLLDLGIAIGSGLLSVITAIISSIYMLAGKERLVPQLKRTVYAVLPLRYANWFLKVCRDANRIFVGFINGKLIDSAIIGLLCFILCVVFRIPYSTLISIVVGITNIIPFFGPIIGAIPCVMILVIIDPWAALRFFVLVIGLQQFDGNILGPKILGDSTGLPALGVLIAIVTGGGLFGFPGMILGVPTFALLYSLLRDWVNYRLRTKHLDENGAQTESFNANTTTKSSE